MTTHNPPPAEGVRVPSSLRMTQVQQTLRSEIRHVAARFRRLKLWKSLAVAWLLAAVVGGLVWLSENPVGRPQVVVPVLAGLALFLAAIGVWRAWSTAPGETDAAREIERAFPELGSSLLAAIEQRPDLPDGRFGFLQSSVILQAASHSSLQDWKQVVPGSRLLAAMTGQFAALALCVATLVGVSLKPGVPASAGTALVTPRPGSDPSGAFAFTVEPGDTEIEKGTSLLVLARVTGAIPAEATLTLDMADGGAGERSTIAMSRSLNDPVFGGRVPIVTAPLSYSVDLEGERSPTYQVTVFEYPRLERADARLQYPKYTGLEDRVVEDVRSLSVVEGTTLILTCHLNKPVASATLTEADQPSITLLPVEGERPRMQVSILCDRSRKLGVALVDEQGRSNVQSAEIRIQVVPNQPPTVKPTFPARDVEVSAIEELDVKATVWDDFGVPRAGVTYSLAGRTPTEAILGAEIAGKNRQEIAHSIPLETLGAQPDELVAYYFWAEDIGPDGEVRRTLGDMYFAEVRHFEEIFRQGQAEPGGQQRERRQSPSSGGGSPNANAAQELGELQKQIVNATWKIIRREIGSRLTDGFPEDAKQVAESQSAALDQALQLGERLNDAESKSHVTRVVVEMQRAAELLTEAQEGPAREPLPAALVAEQAAYQALLKLRAREHEIVRQQQSQQSPGAAGAQGRSSQQRQQMDQLELKEEENRYETQRLAQSQNESAEQRETRQVLNRLRELARRQHDLNEQLKDLQSALEEAKTEEKKEEVRQQLKRLQEEQEQILRDTDELQTRMESPENQERMAAERQQLEQAREQVQKASEALEQEQATRAAAAGTRAERGFDDLREDLRRQTSGQFREELRDLVEQARELERAEQDLGQKITQAIEPDADNRSLRKETGREKIAEGLQEQRQRLANMVDRMQQTIQEAETTEPLLSEKLYDAAREVQSQNVPRALEAARQSVAQGLLEDARQLEQQAGRGITEFREKIESAAESVLGDETESLRRAREELRSLSREVNDEIERNDPRGERPRDPTAPREPAVDPSSGEPDPDADPQQPGGTGQRPGGTRPAGDGTPEDDSPQGGRTPRNGENRGAETEQENGTGERPTTEDDAQRPRNRRPGGSPSNEPQDSESSTPGQSPAGTPGGNESPDQEAGAGRPSAEGDQEASQPGSAPNRPGGRNPNRRPGQNPPQEGQPADGETTGSPTGERRQPGGRPGQNGAQTPTREGDPGGFAPFTGRDFRDWSDRLRDVEEMVSDPDLRAEAARIRDRARNLRAEARRNSAVPNWDMVRMQVAEPLAELTNRVAEELLRRNSKQKVVPLDRDPVPPRYSEKTRRYYERLGSGQ